MINEIIHGDCLEIMPMIKSGSVDMILCDLPYGTTDCEWDSIIPFPLLWPEYERIIKSDGAIVLTSSQPFTSALVMSNIKMFRCEWIWKKTIAANFGTLKWHPAKKHESILVFSKKGIGTYNPKMETGKPYSDKARARGNKINAKSLNIKTAIDNDGVRFPSSVQEFPNPNNNNFHPTQKPLELFRYMIETYTNIGETVLDNCIGSGTTAEAALSCGRNFIGIEKELKYVVKARRRIENVQPVMNF